MVKFKIKHTSSYMKKNHNYILSDIFKKIYSLFSLKNSNFAQNIITA